MPGYDAPECILQRRVAEALARAQAELREQSLGLKVYDCYRPARATRAFLRWIGDDTASGSKRYFPRTDKSTLHMQGYISPNSAHSRGIAVDLTLVRLPAAEQQAFDRSARHGPCNGRCERPGAGQLARHGHGLDCFDVMSQTNSAGRIQRAERGMRRLLRTMMRKHGFQSYWREWWHFSFATRARRARDFAIEQRRAD